MCLISLPGAIFATLLGYRCYYMTIENIFVKIGLSEKTLKLIHICPLNIENKEKLNSIRIYDAGYEEYAYSHAENYFSTDLTKAYEVFFSGVTNLRSKLLLTIRTRFSNHEIGLFVLGTDLGKSRDTGIWYVHDSFSSYMFRDHGVEEASYAKHAGPGTTVPICQSAD